MLLHSDIYLPEEIKSLPAKKYNVLYSTHAIEAAKNDRYGKITLSDKIIFSGLNIFEAEIINKELTKIVIRIAYDNTNDLCLAIAIKENGLMVKTVWLNSKNDNHKTLDTSKYYNPK